MYRKGESQKVFIELSARDLSIWDVNVHDWSLVAGKFKVCVGGTSYSLNMCEYVDIKRD